MCIYFYRESLASQITFALCLIGHEGRVAAKIMRRGNAWAPKPHVDLIAILAKSPVKRNAAAEGSGPPSYRRLFI